MKHNIFGITNNIKDNFLCMAKGGLIQKQKTVYMYGFILF